MAESIYHDDYDTHCDLVRSCTLLLQKIEIRGFSKHTSFAEEEEWFRHFTSIQHLTFAHCDNLGSLPAQLRHLSSLKKLRITGCLKIQPMPDLDLPTSLEELFIHGCHPELARQCRNKDGPHWHKIAAIPDVRILDYPHEVIYECSTSGTSQLSLKRIVVVVLMLLLLGILTIFPDYISSLRITRALYMGITLKRSL